MLSDTHKKECRGLTLIELLLYMALSTIMVVLLGGIGINMLEGRSKVHAQGEVLYNTQRITETIRTAIDGAESITTPTTGATSSSLTLVMRDESRNPTRFSLVDDVVYIQVGEEEPSVLGGKSVVIPVLTFTNVTRVHGPGAVQVTLHTTAYNPEQRSAFAFESFLTTTMSLKYTP